MRCKQEELKEDVFMLKSLTTLGMMHGVKVDYVCMYGGLTLKEI